MGADKSHPGRLRRALSRLTIADEEIEAEELREEAREEGAGAVDELVPRQRATVCGVLRTVTIQPRAGVPSLAAELYDGTGTVELVWLGRRQIAGIDPGRNLLATGRVTMTDEGFVIFNPVYTLRPGDAE